MKPWTMLLVIFILTAAGVAGVLAAAGGPDNDPGPQVQNPAQDNRNPVRNQSQAEYQVRNGTQDQPEGTENPVRNQSQAEYQVRNGTQDQPGGTGSPVRNQSQDQLNQQDQVRNQTRAMNGTILYQQLRERTGEQEQAGLSSGQPGVSARYSNVSAFVRILLNESQNNALFGEGARGIGPQVSEYARQFNNSLQVQIRAEEQIENRNYFVRLLTGGNEEAAAILEQETVRNQERILQMQQLVSQCQDCDDSAKELLRVQLQDMEQVQTRLLQLARQENADLGIFGWLRT